MRIKSITATALALSLFMPSTAVWAAERSTSTDTTVTSGEGFDEFLSDEDRAELAQADVPVVEPSGPVLTAGEVAGALDAFAPGDEKPVLGVETDTAALAVTTDTGLVIELPKTAAEDIRLKDPLGYSMSLELPVAAEGSGPASQRKPADATTATAADDAAAATATATADAAAEPTVPGLEGKQLRLKGRNGVVAPSPTPASEDATSIAGDAQAKVAADGTVIYQEHGDASAVAAQVLNDDSVRMAVVIPDAAAPRSFDVKLNIGDYMAPALQPDGRVLIMRLLQTDDPNTEDVVEPDVWETVFEMRSPWAKDANGKDVKTWYTLEGTTLT